MNFLILIVIAVIVAWAPPTIAALPEKVTVDLFEAHQPVRQVTVFGPVQIEAPFTRALPGGKFTLSIKAGQLQLVDAASTTGKPIASAVRFVFHGDLKRGVSLALAGMSKRSYEGTVDVSLFRGLSLKIRNVVPVKDYVVSVVSSETPAKWPKEALKAQAVLTQTRLARHLPSMVTGDSTQRELYLGSDSVRPEVRDAVSSVWGQSLLYDNRPIAVFYHSTCAGGTSGGEAIFANRSAVPPYLVPIYCIYCNKSPFAKETVRRVSKESAVKAFGEGQPEVAEVDGTNRPLRVKLANGRILTGYQFWILMGNSVGWDKAPGSRYKISTLTNGDLEISSTGAGHGVGLCQWGAAEMARDGKSYKEILQFYFPGTEIRL